MFQQFRISALPAFHALLFGIAYGLLVLHAALEHNPQSEFYKDGSGIVLSNAAPLFFLAVTVAGLIIFTIEIIVYLFIFRNKFVLKNESLRLLTHRSCFVPFINAVLLTIILVHFFESWGLLIGFIIFVTELLTWHFVQKINKEK